jgi:hypothetical protein
MINSWITKQICTNNMTIWRHEIKKIIKELNNYELSRTKRNFQKIKKSTNYPNFQETQLRLLKYSRIKTNQLPNDQGFFKHVFGQNSNKVIFFLFFCAAAIKISRSSLLLYIYIGKNKTNQEHRCVCRFWSRKHQKNTNLWLSVQQSNKK